jgi:hypothetical protein
VFHTYLHGWFSKTELDMRLRLTSSPAAHVYLNDQGKPVLVSWVNSFPERVPQILKNYKDTVCVGKLDVFVESIKTAEQARKYFKH